MTGERDPLWEPAAGSDPELERLERLFGSLRAPRELPVELRRALAGPAGASPVRRISPLAAAAGLLVAGSLLALGPWLAARPPGYRVVGSQELRVARVGDRLIVGEEDVELTIGSLGAVRVAPGSKLRVEAIEHTRTQRHELYLEEGELVATIRAEPRVFRIGSPAGLTIDLGCAYRLTVEEDGSTELEVLEGQVSFGRDGREVYVPAGASCIARPDVGPLPPLFVDADPRRRELVHDLAEGRVIAEQDLVWLLEPEDREDLLPLFELVTDPRVGRSLRARILEELDRYLQRPAEVGAAELLDGDAGMRERWLDAVRWGWRR